MLYYTLLYHHIIYYAILGRPAEKGRPPVRSRAEGRPAWTTLGRVAAPASAIRRVNEYILYNVCCVVLYYPNTELQQMTQTHKLNTQRHNLSGPTSAPVTRVNR